MRVGFFVVLALVTLSLPCVDLPEWAGTYNDPSNDSVVMLSRLVEPLCVRRLRTPRVAIVYLNRHAASNLSASAFYVLPIPSDTRALLDRLSVQKK